MKKCLIFNLVENKQTTTTKSYKTKHTHKRRKNLIREWGDRNECVTETGEAIYLKFFVSEAQ